MPAGMTLLELKTEAFNAWSPGQTWFAWCSTTGSTVTMQDSAWTAWNVNVTSTTDSSAFNYPSNTAYVSNGTSWISWNTAYEETEEQKREREAGEAAARAGWEEREAERAGARERSEGLLLSLLSEEQGAAYREHGWFEVRGSRGGRWRIRNRGQSGNVDLMPEIGEERDATYCAHPPGRLPDADAYVAQMLALVTDEEKFVKTANVHWRRPRQEPAPALGAVA